MEGDASPAGSAPRQKEGGEVADPLERLLPRRQWGEEEPEEVRGQRGRMVVAALLDEPRLLSALAVGERVAQSVEARARREGVVAERRRQPAAELIQVLPQVLREDWVVHALVWFQQREARRDS